MSTSKLLIDTNVFIGLEDQKQVDPTSAEIVRKCNEYSVGLFVHEAALRDIARDKDEARRKISLSKFAKFQRVKDPKPEPDKAELEKLFGPIRNSNDEVDAALLYALHLNVVDFLVTEDTGIHGRVRLGPLADRVFRVADALTWLRRTYDTTPVSLPFIDERKAYEIDRDDPIFESLRDGYPRFDNWWTTKCVNQHRDCWAVTVDDEIAGLVVRKTENRTEATVKLAGNKILKLCTFKVREDFRGEKLGELLLKQALWFAQVNAFDLVYLTTKASQTALIALLEYYGFQYTHSLGDELIFEKPLSRDRLVMPLDEKDVFRVSRTNYPRFVADAPAKVFCVPIQGDYHQKLFPELAFEKPLPLFPSERRLITASGARTPGNTIRKVYLCRAQTNSIEPGDILLFYHSKAPNLAASQSITSVGIAERVSQTHDLDALIRLTAKRSVFSERELRGWIDEKPSPVKVIDFLLVGHLSPPMPLETLNAEGVFSGHPPQSITALSPHRFAPIRRRLALGFEV
jgi:ribosomal protein S18 acetylase RimI-like enzyme